MSMLLRRLFLGAFVVGIGLAVSVPAAVAADAGTAKIANIRLKGDLDDAKTLIPLEWLLKQLADCKAQQKILIADLNRYDPARGVERPNGGKLAASTEAMLKNPPPGVQVVSASSKDQYSYEFDDYAVSQGFEIKGGAFLAFFMKAFEKGIGGISRPGDPIPIEAIAGLHVQAHGGDPAKSLAVLAVGRSTRESLARAGGPEVEATLGHVASVQGSTHENGDPDRTGGYSVGSATSDGQRFRILRPHAKGGLGAVYVALDSELDRDDPNRAIRRRRCAGDGRRLVQR